MSSLEVLKELTNKLCQREQELIISEAKYRNLITEIRNIISHEQETITVIREQKYLRKQSILENCERILINILNVVEPAKIEKREIVNTSTKINQ